MQTAADLLLALRDPLALLRMRADQLTDLVARARATDLLGRIGARLRRARLDAALPERMRGVLEAPMIAAEAHQRMARFETDRIHRVIRDLVPHFVLLKGSAYVLAELPPAQGRSLSDVDILVARDALSAVEERLLRSGWVHIKTTEYDQKYFREWMHELPPLRHKERNTIIDLHHTILPITGRLRPDPMLLIADATPVAGWPGITVLAPADMVLHNIVHHFQDGEFRHSLRELVDLDDLLGHFAAQPGFWDKLIQRTDQLGFGRPAFYALRYASNLLGTSVPPQVAAALSRHAPPAPVLAAMDRLIPSCLLASGRLPRGISERIAGKALYARAQWLKMPPALLARHTLSKLFRGPGRRAVPPALSESPAQRGDRTTAARGPAGRSRGSGTTPAG